MIFMRLDPHDGDVKEFEPWTQREFVFSTKTVSGPMVNQLSFDDY